MFIKHLQKSWVYILVCVDDVIVTGPLDSEVEDVISQLKNTFAMKDLG